MLTAALALAGASAAQPDFRPTQDIVLDTDCSTVLLGGSLQTVEGGVFTFRDVVIPDGVTVRGRGSNPLVLVCTRDCIIRGALRVDGEDGASVLTLNSANFPVPGGAGGCAAGSGGTASPYILRTSPAGLSGNSREPRLGAGGSGAVAVPAVPSPSSPDRSPAGGGGGFATQGDPFYPFDPSLPRWTQVSGRGGAGGTGPEGSPFRVPAGGDAGPTVFRNATANDDFFGVGVDLNVGAVIQGELRALRGGNGGGAGGDRRFDGVSFVNDERGGAGGGGGGALLILTGGRIILDGGEVSADGGNGGGGEQAASNNRCGGGGGGSGGMVVLAAAGGLDLRVVESRPRASALGVDGDYRFAVSADGGIGLQSAFTSEIAGKYGTTLDRVGDPSWNQFPAGGFGGLGLVQFVTRPGTNQDGTNTILDDSITVRNQMGTVLTGAAKQAALAWRGFPGSGVDDQGNPIALGSQIGDVYPPPILQPLLN